MIQICDFSKFKSGLMASATLVLVAVVSLGSPLHAGTPEGVWLTEPDAKGQRAHVVSSRCGNSFCGTITEVFDRNGAPVAAPTVGQRVFWDMQAKGDTFSGRAYVPAHRREYAARMQVNGNQMTVKGCLGPVCQSQKWRRVR